MKIEDSLVKFQVFKRPHVDYFLSVVSSYAYACAVCIVALMNTPTVVVRDISCRTEYMYGTNHIKLNVLRAYP